MDMISKRFCDPNADLTLRSSDGMLFKVFSKDLEAYSEAFPSPDVVIKPDANEVVVLSETSQVLELLLQYMRRQRQPDIQSIGFDILAPLAEAAEKYQVFSATEICKATMTIAVPQHPMEILGYATRHGYSKLADLAAPLTLDLHFGDASEHLSTYAQLAWVEYREKWLEVLRYAYTVELSPSVSNKHNSTCGGRSNVPILRNEILFQYGAKLGPLVTLNLHYNPPGQCRACQDSIESWLMKIYAKIARLRPFHEFLSV